MVAEQLAKMKKTLNKKNKGFTLIEIMVAVSIFSIVMMVSIGAVLAIVAANKKAESLSSVINNLNFALESMNRDLRTGFDYICIDLSGSACGGIQFTSSQSEGDTITYTYDSSTKTINKTNKDGTFAIISNEIYIDSLQFYLADTEKTSAGNLRQPRILMILKGCAGVHRLSSCDASDKNTSIFNLQTFITQRRADI